MDVNVVYVVMFMFMWRVGPPCLLPAPCPLLTPARIHFVSRSLAHSLTHPLAFSLLLVTYFRTWLRQLAR